MCAGRYPLLEQGALNDLLPVATGRGVPLPAAAVQFPLRHPAVATVCVGARSAEQVDRNVALFDVQIPDAL
jgi:D-threo-aldose 1-dehydrogenase